MKKFSLLLLFLLLLPGCSQQVKDDSNGISTFSNTTAVTKTSSDSIDGAQTFEVFFKLDKPAECISVEMTSVFLQKTFPLQKIPKKTFFIVEKELKLPGHKMKTVRQFIALGKNFNSDWESFTPVKICNSKNDPISRLNGSDYRIRFTIFEKTEFYYIINISSDSKIIFGESTAPVVH